MTKGGTPDFCGVEVRARNGEIEKVAITLRGEIAQFPSTSNSREIRYKWGFSRKNGKRTRLPFLAKSKYQTERLALITAHYTRAILSAGMPPPSFGAEKVTVFVTLAQQKGRFDSHNFSKPIGDWLQFIGIMNDDTQAEIFCRKAVDYKTEVLTTRIQICRRVDVCGSTHALFEAHGEAGQTE